MEISIVMPVYNEEECIEESYKRITKVLSCMNRSYEIICVNDGSNDKSLEILSRLAAKDKNLKILSFSRNFGHQLAVSAGLKYCSGQAVVIIDADMQDPPEIIPDMVQKWQEGYDVVFGARRSRKGESAFKLFTAKIFYRIINSLTGNMVPMDTGDFRLIDKKISEVMNAMPEHARFLRGMGSWVGFHQFAFPYDREERFAGHTKYTLKKMLKLASDGIFSFSTVLLALPYTLGFILLAAGLIWLIVLICLAHHAIGEWQIIVAACSLLSGIILICMGIIGTYIGRIYEEAKGRPLYIIDKTIGFSEEEKA